MEKFFDAFISYGRADSKAFATKLYEKLTAQGFNIWFDQNDIPLAVDFQEQINDGIEKAHNFFFIIAPHSVNSPYCAKEIELAIKYNKRIIPLLHVEQITQEIYQQRNPHKTDSDWQEYQKKGLHSSFPNMNQTIGKINWVYFREKEDDFDNSLTGLTTAIKKNQEYVEQHTDYLIQGLEWARNQQQTNYLLVGESRKKAADWLSKRFDEQAPCIPTDLHCEFISESIKNANNLMTDVFLAYAEKNENIKEKIRRSLMRESLTVWTNKTDIKTGIAFEEAINQGVEGADNFVYLISPESIKSEYCQQELDHALTNNKRIIPLLIEETDLDLIPSQVRDLQFIDFREHRAEDIYQKSIDKLLKELKQDAHYYETHKTLLVKALKWQKQNKNPSLFLRGYNLQKFEAWLKVAQTRNDYPPLPLQEEFIAASLKQPETASLEVFISYSRTDSDLARKLNDNLQELGKTTWFDQESIATGTDFQKEIYRGIENSDNFLFVISPKSINSPYCADEVEYAQKLNKRFVTILHRPLSSEDKQKLHPALASVQWLDFNKHGGEFAANFNELVRTLDTDRDHVRSHTKWSQRALEWKQKKKSADLLLPGSELIIAQNWLQEAQQQKLQPAATPLQKEFISKSKQHRRRNKQLQIGALAAFMMVLATGTFVMLRSQTLNKAVQLSERAVLVKNLLPTEPLEGLIIAIQATGQSESSFKRVLPQVKSSLLSAIQISKESHRFRGVNDWLNSVAISPDGKTIAAALDYDKTVRLWDLKGNPIGELFAGHEDSINSVAFSPDGKMIVTGSRDKTVRLWDLKGNPMGGPFRGHESDKYGVRSVVFSRDGKMIVTGSKEKTVLWDLKGNPIKQFLSGGAVAFSPDEKTIVIARQEIQLWDLKGNPLGKPFEGNGLSIRSVAFSPDGKMIVTGSGDKTVRLWNLQGKAIGTPFSGHEELVTSVIFSPDGKMIISGSDDGTIRLWDLEGNPIGEPLRGHYAYVSSVAISPNGKTLVSAGSQVRLWHLESNAIGQPFTGHENNVNSVAFSPDGTMIFTGSKDQTVRLWDLKGNPIGQPFTGHEDSVTSVAFSPDGTMIVTGSQDNTVRLWDLKGNAIGQPFRGHEDYVDSVAFSPDGKTIVSGGWDKKVRLWDLKGNPIGEPFGGHQNFITSVAFSPDGKTIVSGGWDKKVRLWDLKGNPIGQPFGGHQSFITSVAFSPDGKTIVSGSEDKTVRLWDLDGNPLGEPLKGHQSFITSVAFSPDGKTIVSGSDDKTVRLWRWGDWQDWLQVGCNRLAYHPVLLKPETEAAKDAGETCLRLANWDETEKTGFLVRQGQMIAQGGDVETGVSKFKAAQKLNPDIDLDPSTETIHKDPLALAKILAAPAKVKEGEKLAKKGNIPDAIAKFEAAQKLNPDIDLDPSTETIDKEPLVLAQILAAPAKVQEGRQLAQKGKIPEAIAKFSEAQKLNPDIDLDPSTETIDKDPQSVAENLAAPTKD
ncbi:MAG: TIR domain-containing protein [Crocosphaera sp.]|nr:TIR domain-containing protein [Crocosphaera sp.]